MMTKKAKEIWIPIRNLSGECSLYSIKYDANSLNIELEPFNNKSLIDVSFDSVFAYRLTLEHFRWNGIPPVNKREHPLYIVENSMYINWLLDEGFKQLYGTTLPLKHYVLYCTEHIIDIISSEIVISNNNSSSSDNYIYKKH